MFRLFDFRNFKYLSYLKDVKGLIFLALILLFIYLMVKSPTIETSTKIQLDKVADTTKNNSNDTINILK